MSEHVRCRAARALRCTIAVALLVLCAGPTPDAAAMSSSGALVVGGATSAPTPPVGVYAPPVDGQVVDPFRAPEGPYGPGNRGLEYRTTPGSSARAIGAGRVSFAGPVAGRLVVSIEHPDGLTSSLTGLAHVAVRRDDLVVRGQVVGLTGARLHLGVRSSGTYLDPAALFDDGPRRAVLVPVPR